MVTWSNAQKQRLVELNADFELQKRVFTDVTERDEKYQELESRLVSKNKHTLLQLKNSGAVPLVDGLINKLASSLRTKDFVQVSTPLILTKNMLEKMTITSDSHLSDQVFWLDKNKCLRPMLAPNLYSLMKDLMRTWGESFKIFEVGPCFRKESQGKYHLNEFTMLNLVELGVPEGHQMQRIEELITVIMEAVGITEYEIVKSSSEVYGETIDVECGGLELCSGAFGPHRLDNQWGIFTPWVGLGIGIERLAMVIENHRNIRRVGRSLSYLNGIRLNI